MKLIFVIFLLFVVESFATYQLSKEKVDCYWSRNLEKLRCVKVENQNNGNGPRWPNFIGIGPAKTGSTSLFDLLAKHENVSIASNEYADRPCCGSETYFLVNAADMNRGASIYSSFFKPISKTNNNENTILMAGEKTPCYSYATMVPYHAAAHLKQPVKLIFTIRDAVESDISLYLYRGIDIKYKVSYLEWVTPRVEIFVKYMKCRKDLFNSFLVPDSHGRTDYATVRDMYNASRFSWKDTANMETLIFKTCFQELPPGLAFPLYDHIPERLHAENMQRWIHVFGRENFLCIENDDQIQQPEKVQERVAQFLQLPVGGWKGYVNQARYQAKQHATGGQQQVEEIMNIKGYVGNTIYNNSTRYIVSQLRSSTLFTTFRRLADSQEQYYCLDTINEAIALIYNTLKAYTSDEDINYVNNLCKNL